MVREFRSQMYNLKCEEDRKAYNTLLRWVAQKKHFGSILTWDVIEYPDNCVVLTWKEQ